MILLIDNYDSFVFNLARYFERLGQPTHVVRNDAIDTAGILGWQPAAVVISPGPGSPENAGCSIDAVRALVDHIPLLGVCLGHQAIAAALGGRVARAREPMHGRASLIYHDGQSLFAGLPNPISGCRYHSLEVEEQSLPRTLEVTARTADGTIMAIAHRDRPVVGIQFHPESILSDAGFLLLARFLALAGIAQPIAPPDFASELVASRSPGASLPNEPVTF